MTKSTSFRLSDEALGQLAMLAERFKKSQTAVIEHMIFDRASASDQKQNSIRRRTRWEMYAEFRSTWPMEWHDTIRTAFVNGYNRGWVDFQTRHGVNEFIIPSPGESDE